MLEHNKIEDLTDSLHSYVKKNCEIIKFELIENTSSIGSSVITNLILVLVTAFIILFVSLSAGFYLSDLIGNTYVGFLIVAGFYLILGTILLIGRKVFMERPLRNKIIHKILNRNY